MHCAAILNHLEAHADTLRGTGQTKTPRSLVMAK